MPLRVAAQAVLDASMPGFVRSAVGLISRTIVSHRLLAATLTVVSIGALLRMAVASSSSAAFAVGVRAPWIMVRPIERYAGCDRALRVLVWYPAESSGLVPPLTVGSYVEAARAPDENRPLRVQKEVRDLAGDSAVRAQLDDVAGATLTSAEIAQVLATPAMAHLDLPPVRRRFPLAIVGNGSGPPFYLNWSLAEHLAAAGYVVASIVGVGCGAPRAFDRANVEAMARDMETVIDALRTATNVDPSRVGLIGWSVSGAAQVIVAATDTNVRALVSLDGASGYRYGKEILDSTAAVGRRRIPTPYVHITGDGPSRSPVPKDSTYFDSTASGPAYLVHVSALTHPQFTSLGALLSRFNDPSHAPAVERSYAAVTRYGILFFDTYLLGRSGARLDDPWATLGLERRDFRIRRRPPSAPTP